MKKNKKQYSLDFTSSDVLEYRRLSGLRGWAAYNQLTASQKSLLRIFVAQNFNYRGFYFSTYISGRSYNTMIQDVRRAERGINKGYDTPKKFRYVW